MTRKFVSIAAALLAASAAGFAQAQDGSVTVVLSEELDMIGRAHV